MLVADVLASAPLCYGILSARVVDRAKSLNSAKAMGKTIGLSGSLKSRRTWVGGLFLSKSAWSVTSVVIVGTSVRCASPVGKQVFDFASILLAGVFSLVLLLTRCAQTTRQRITLRNEEGTKAQTCIGAI